MSKPEHKKLAEQFAQSWTDSLKLTSENIAAQDFDKHLLGAELNALQNGETASLPFFRSDSILWVTTAPDAENLEMAVEDLRAWVLPSLGWEDEKSSIVLPDDAPVPIRNLISVVSPSGYFRWWTKKTKFEPTVKKLRSMRRLNESRPKHIYQHVPSLFELRQQYEVALLVKDEDSAQKAINSIDRDQLDTAANTGFMQIHLWSEFREFEKIVNHPQLRELLQLRMPHSVRLDFVNAFHAQFLRKFEARNDFAGAKKSYQENVALFLDGLLTLCRPSDGLAASRFLAYKALLKKDSNLAGELLEKTSDDYLKNLLKSLRVETVPTLELSFAAQFQAAHQKNDWRAMQETGAKILFDTKIQNEELPRDYVLAILRFSLNFRANPELQEKLDSLDSADKSTRIPQTWLEFATQVREKRWENASAFLSLENRPTLGNADLATALLFLETFEELFTDPDLENELIGREILQSALPAIIREFLTAPEFPKADLVSVYRQLMQLWAIYKSGSSSPIDANLLLTLAEPVLQNDGSSENIVSQTLREWWEARKVRALLPFLLNSLEILSENLSTSDVSETLWIDGAEFVRLHPESISPTERHLWRTLGAKIGLSKEIINEFLGAEIIDVETDVLAELRTIRIAIVSLQVEAAQTAADLIRQRAAANVIVVSETHNNSSVENAKNSDVILFVWASNTHAVYRAFDSSREKLVYVQGKGASSIVISLERWAINQQ